MMSIENTGARPRHSWFAMWFVFVVLLVGVAFATFYTVQVGLPMVNPASVLLGLATAGWALGLALMWRGQWDRGIYVALSAVLVTIPLTSLWIVGLGLNLGLGVGLIFVLIATVVLPPARGQWFIVLGFVAILATVGLDAVGASNRLSLVPSYLATAAIVTPLVLVLAFFVIRNFQAYPLRVKLLLAFVTLALVSVAAVTYVVTLSVRSALTESETNELRSHAQSASVAIGITMDRNVDRLQTLTLDKGVQDDATQLTDIYPATQAARQTLIQEKNRKWQAHDPNDPVIQDALNGKLAYSLHQFSEVFGRSNQELFMTDAYGSVIAATDWQETYNFADALWWKIAFGNGTGNVFISQPEYNTMLQKYGVRIAVPIFSPGRQRVVGVLHSIYTLDDFTHVLSSNGFEQSGKIDLLFPLGQVLTSEGTFRELAPSEFTEIKDGIAQPLATLNYRGTPLLSAQSVVGVANQQPEPFLRASAWRTIATVQENEALALVQSVAQSALLTGVLTVGAGIIVALLLALFLTRPIRRLTAVAEEIQAGNLAARAPVDSGDEIGTLAKTFNTMTGRLQETLASLERRVAERTQELSDANLSLQANSSYLAALSDTSVGLFERLNLKDLLQAILERAADLMGTQNGFVFFAEPGEQEIQMRVGSGLYDDLIGTRAQAGVGMAGTVWQTGKPMVIRDYQKWEGRLPGSRRDALRAIVALPLKRGAGKGSADDETVGVIGLAYTDSERQFGDAEVQVLERFAQLASIALDNAKLYAETEARVLELGALNTISQLIVQSAEPAQVVDRIGDEIIRIFGADFGYFALLNPETKMIDFVFGLDNGKRITLPSMPIGQGITSQVITTGKPLLMTHASPDDYVRLGAVDSGDGTSPQTLMAVPIRAGDVVIGALSVQRLSSERTYTEDDQNLLTTIAANIGVGIENVRLAQATQQRVQELSSLNRIGTALNSTASLQERIKEVGRQLGQIFQVSSVYIALFDPTQDLVTMPFFVEDGVEADVPPAPRGTGFVSHIIETRQPLVINNHLLDRFQELGGIWIGNPDGDPLSYLGVPITAGDQVYGVVALNGNNEGRFTDADVRFLGTIAASIATAIENARLLEQTRQALDETQRLAASERQASEQVMALNRRLTREGWKEYLDFEAGAVVAEATTMGVRQGGAAVSQGNGTNGDHDGKGKPVQVPIVLRGETIGTVELDYDDPDAEWSEERQALVQDVLENFGLALDNARLTTETQRRVTELDALNQISQAVSSELDLESLLVTIGTQLRNIFDVDNAYIALYDRETEMISLPYFINDDVRVNVEPIPFGEGLSSQIIRTRKSLLMNQNTDETMSNMGAKVFGKPAMSYLGVPIFAGEEVTGVISIQSTTRPGMFDESNQRLLETIAATVGTAIQSAQLYGAMQQEVVTRQRAEEEIKLSLKEKEVLLKEIHHRVKNNLQIITSLLNLQSAQIKDPDAIMLFRESQSRVRSMALIHEKLYQSKDLARIDFDGYLRDLMVYLFRSYAANADQIRIHVESNNMSLEIDTAIPCGLMISELVTNTLKYAFPGGRRGNLWISIGPEDAGHLALLVKDDGVGFKEGFNWRESDSLGLQLVSTLTSQLHGTIEVNGVGGTSFKITFPG